MSAAKHTPGPWIAVGGWVEHPDDDIPDICVCDPACFAQGDRSDAEMCANARLIAAAPELLKALQRALPTLIKDTSSKGKVNYWSAKDAIAMATGGKA